MEFDALDAGLAYAFYRHGQDKQAEKIIAALQQADQQAPAPAPTTVTVNLDEEPDLRSTGYHNALDYSKTKLPDGWDDYVGQPALKRQMMIYINQSLRTGEPLPHTLFASGMPGVGKTTAARLVADALKVDIIELVPPFNVYTLAQAADELLHNDILFIDEIHKLSDNGKRGAEILLKALEDRVIFLPNGEVVELSNITIIGATTDADKLPEPVLDRFKIKPYFQPYSLTELAEIAAIFTTRHDAWPWVTTELCVNMAEASRGTPRVIEEMVMAARALGMAYDRPPTTQELLAFLEVEPDGLTRQHIHYLTALRQFFGRETKEGLWEFVAGESSMIQLLRETPNGVARIERFLIEKGLLDRTPRGRRLTDRGIARANAFIRAGKGASHL